MSGPENRSAISYTGNILARVSGVDEFRQIRNQWLVLGNSAVEANLKGLVGMAIKPIIPAAARLDSTRNDKQYLPQLGLTADLFIGLGVPLVLGGRELENVAAILTARLAYNVAVEVVPDALKAIRRNFHPSTNSTLGI